MRPVDARLSQPARAAQLTAAGAVMLRSPAMMPIRTDRRSVVVIVVEPSGRHQHSGRDWGSKVSAPVGQAAVLFFAELHGRSIRVYHLPASETNGAVLHAECRRFAGSPAICARRCPIRSIEINSINIALF